MRAITGIPLKDPQIIGFPAMVNIISEMPRGGRGTVVEGTVMHDYGKSPRPGRKLAHVTVVGNSLADRDSRVEALQQTIDKS